MSELFDVNAWAKTGHTMTVHWMQREYVEATWSPVSTYGDDQHWVGLVTRLGIDAFQADRVLIIYRGDGMVTTADDEPYGVVQYIVVKLISSYSVETLVYMDEGDHVGERQDVLSIEPNSLDQQLQLAITLRKSDQEEGFVPWAAGFLASCSAHGDLSVTEPREGSAIAQALQRLQEDGVAPTLRTAFELMAEARTGVRPDYSWMSTEQMLKLLAAPEITIE